MDILEKFVILRIVFYVRISVVNGKPEIGCAIGSPANKCQ